ncbi:hypothetical protein OE88DRAFT_1657834 [Heliocybe sulcata]|uniref:F-box domain-containing protein n=1 Tax=Heliocybe sulcata TaxID=5364 RepID=A0A5C3N4F2_9AGAM|nr:hypothetical protein OE88DRAFT_1657834 [Heliocybe sulcata]
MAASVARESLPVADDVVDYILRTLPDFDSLLALILVSKRIYHIYRRHSKSIRRSIAYSLVGPALPQALRLVRRGSYGSRDPSSWPRESEMMATAITPEDALRLTQKASVLDQLEIVFSRSYKDFYASSSGSMLSQQESHRFHRAMYRFWLYADAFRLDGEPAVDDVKLKGILLSQIPDDADLFELARVVEFLREVLRQVCVRNGECFAGNAPNGDPYDMGYAMSLGPDRVLGLYQGYEALPHPLDSRIILGRYFIRDPLYEAFHARDLPYPDWDSPVMQLIILDDYEHHNLACHICKETKVLVWGPPNWHHLEYHMSTDALSVLFTGNLKRNYYETEGLHHYASLTPSCHVHLMNWLFDHKLDSGIQATVSRDDWMCDQCIRDFIRANLHAWWLERKHAEGIDTPAEDCPLGYHCREQITRGTHAAKLNHLRRPTAVDTDLQGLPGIERWRSMLSEAIDDSGTLAPRSIFR